MHYELKRELRRRANRERSPNPSELATTWSLPYLAVAGNEQAWRAVVARYRPRIQPLGGYVAVTLATCTCTTPPPG